MKEVQKQTSINALAMSMGNIRQAKDVIPRNVLQAALEKQLKRVLVDAFMRGGKLGAEHVKAALKNG